MVDERGTLLGKFGNFSNECLIALYKEATIAYKLKKCCFPWLSSCAWPSSKKEWRKPTGDGRFF